jgi:nicotinamidase/pyrazinamidase
MASARQADDSTLRESAVPGVSDALVVVDVQNDFLPGGALAVPRGDEVVAPLNRWIARFESARRPIFATRDWHPADHLSFRAQGGIWPSHCVAGTPGARFAPALQLPATALVISKATGREEAYSGFSGTELAKRLSDAGVRRLFVGGLATDYCVLNTVLDARAAGFDVVVLGAAVRAVEVEPGDGARALERMRQADAVIMDEA